jgi:HPt (histidine-containing phosphotransfer) domain-containing protein
MNELLLEFIDTLTPRVHDLRAAWQRNDWKVVEALAHKLRGSAGLYGYPELSALADTLEQQAKQEVFEASTTILEIVGQSERIVAGRDYTAQGSPSLPAH